MTTMELSVCCLVTSNQCSASVAISRRGDELRNTLFMALATVRLPLASSLCSLYACAQTETFTCTAHLTTVSTCRDTLLARSLETKCDVLHEVLPL